MQGAACEGRPRTPHPYTLHPITVPECQRYWTTIVPCIPAPGVPWITQWYS